MLSPEYLWSVSDNIVESYDELNNWAVKDMAERLMSAELFNYDKLPGTARYRAWMLNQAGMHYDDMAKQVADITNKSQTDIMKLFIEAGLTAIANDFEPFDMKPYDIRQDKKATQLLQSMYEKTNGELHNYTRTTLNQSQKLMIDVLDKAYFDVSTGAKSYTEAIKESLDTISKKSCTVEYDSGHVDSIETAVRRAVMTGVNQGTSKITLLNCEKLGTDYVIVSAHEGARYNEKNKVANHLGWQGGVYKIHGTGTYSNEKKGIISAIKRFLSKIGFKLKGDIIPNLEAETGFPSNPLGLCGYNCRHSFYPFVPEVDNPKKYKHIVTDVEESKHKYDLSQKQRYKEREIRKLKSDLMCYQTAIDNCQDELTKFELQLDYDKLAACLQKRNKAYREFCQENDLQVESERIKVAKWKREQSYQATRGANSYYDAKAIKDKIKKVNIDAEKLGLNPYNKNINPTVAKSITNEIKKAREIFGDFSVRSVNMLETKVDYDGLYQNGSIYLKNIIGDNAQTKLRARAITMKKSGKWSTNSDMHTARHEIGHAVVDYMKYNDKGWSLKLEKINSIMKKIEDKVSGMTIQERNKYYSSSLSSYAFLDADEFIAESIAEYLNSSKARATAKNVVEILRGDENDLMS